MEDVNRVALAQWGTMLNLELAKDVQVSNVSSD